jgi:hypothetical protein
MTCKKTQISINKKEILFICLSESKLFKKSSKKTQLLKKLDRVIDKKQIKLKMPNWV